MGDKPKPAAINAAEPESEKVLLRRRHLTFLVMSLVFLAAFLLVPIVLLDTDFYVKHSNYFYDPVIDYKASLSNNASDILIYGDSAALHNVVPAAIKKQTNLDVYNLGYSAPVVAGAPNLMLDRYLKRNKLPKTIVLYIAPTTGVNGYDLDTSHFYEAAMVLERYSSLADALRFYSANPRRLFGVAAVVFRNLLTPPEPTEKNYHNVTSILTAQKGWTPTPPNMFQNGVGFLAEIHGGPKEKLVADSKYILEFRKKYEAMGARVLIYLSPVRDCADLSISEVKTAYGQLADNEPYSFPCDSFRGGFHLTERAAEENSLHVGSFLLSELSVTSARP